jgi:hypothetical protein
VLDAVEGVEGLQCDVPPGVDAYYALHILP